MSQVFYQCPCQPWSLQQNIDMKEKKTSTPKTTFDWMASMFIKERININHMKAIEPVKHEKIEDFVPSETKKDYVFFQSLVCYFSSRLVRM